MTRPRSWFNGNGGRHGTGRGQPGHQLELVSGSGGRGRLPRANGVVDVVERGPIVADHGERADEADLGDPVVALLAIGPVPQVLDQMLRRLVGSLEADQAGGGLGDDVGARGIRGEVVGCLVSLSQLERVSEMLNERALLPAASVASACWRPIEACLPVGTDSASWAATSAYSIAVRGSPVVRMFERRIISIALSARSTWLSRSRCPSASTVWCSANAASPCVHRPPDRQPGPRRHAGAAASADTRATASFAELFGWIAQDSEVPVPAPRREQLRDKFPQPKRAGRPQANLHPPALGDAGEPARFDARPGLAATPTVGLVVPRVYREP